MQNRFILMKKDAMPNEIETKKANGTISRQRADDYLPNR